MNGLTWLHFIPYYIATVVLLRVILAWLTRNHVAPGAADALGFIV